MWLLSFFAIHILFVCLLNEMERNYEHLKIYFFASSLMKITHEYNEQSWSLLKFLLNFSSFCFYFTLFYCGARVVCINMLNESACTTGNKYHDGLGSVLMSLQPFSFANTHGKHCWKLEENGYGWIIRIVASGELLGLAITSVFALSLFTTSTKAFSVVSKWIRNLKIQNSN